MLSAEVFAKIQWPRWVLVVLPWCVHSTITWLFATSKNKNGGPAYRTPIAFRPPGYVFAIVWSVLYLLMGVYATTLVYARDTSPAFRETPWLFGALLAVYAANFVLNACWMPVVNKYERVSLGIYLIAAMFACALAVFQLDPDPARRAMWVPYAAWLLVALALNVELARHK